MSHTMIYADFQDGKMVHYVRFCPVETRAFPHGLSIGGINFPTREGAEEYRKLVDAYIRAFVKSLKEDQ